MRKQLDIRKLSIKYAVRTMTRDQIPEIYALAQTNPQFEAFCSGPMTQASIARDLTITPPGMTLEDKYYVGFYSGNRLIAVLDLITGYPDSVRAFIGFFMVHGSCSGQGVGGAMVEDICRCLGAEDFHAVQLAYAADNPQAEYFWTKQGFVPQREAKVDGGNYIVAERKID